MTRGSIAVFALNSSRDFGEKVCRQLGVSLSAHEEDGIRAAYVRNLRIILLSISEWYYCRVLLPEIVATLVGFSLIVQGRPIDRYLTGELTEIMNPSRNRYEYTILTKEDGYIGRSSKPIRVTKGSEVRFKIQGRSLYIIDMVGKTQRLRYAVHLNASAPVLNLKDAFPTVDVSGKVVGQLSVGAGIEQMHFNPVDGFIYVAITDPGQQAMAKVDPSTNNIVIKFPLSTS